MIPMKGREVIRESLVCIKWGIWGSNSVFGGLPDSIYLQVIITH